MTQSTILNYVKLQAELNEKYQTEHNKLFFFSMAPQFFGTIGKHLKSEQIVDGKGFERLIVEKPLVTDYETASKLNEELLATFNEEQIYRIDHYLGKEMIQSIFAVRFANMIFENVWNRETLSTMFKLPLQSVWVLKNVVATMMSLVPFATWFKTTHFSFCHSLLWTSQQASQRMTFVQRKLRSFKNLYHPTDEELKDTLHPWAIPFW